MHLVVIKVCTYTQAHTHPRTLRMYIHALLRMKNWRITRTWNQRKYYGLKVKRNRRFKTKIQTMTYLYLGKLRQHKLYFSYSSKKSYTWIFYKVTMQNQKTIPYIHILICYKLTWVRPNHKAILTVPCNMHNYNQIQIVRTLRICKPPTNGTMKQKARVFPERDRGRGNLQNGFFSDNCETWKYPKTLKTLTWFHNQVPLQALEPRWPASLQLPYFQNSWF